MAAKEVKAFRLEPLLIEAMDTHIQVSDSMCLNQRELVEWVLADYFYRTMRGNVHPKQLDKETAGGRSHRGIFKFYRQWCIAFYGGTGYRLQNPNNPRKSFCAGKDNAKDFWVVTAKEFFEGLHAQDTIK